MHWFTKSWWEWLLAKPSDYYDVSRWRAFWCRLRGHQHPLVWFNVSGSEPDYHCSNCGDDLG